MRALLLLKKLLERLCMSQKAVHYLCGTEVLPHPLDPERENELLKRIADGDNSAKDVLVEHNLRLVVFLAKKFESTGLDMEDLVSVGTIGLIKAINSFKAEKQIKLATYASRCIENEIDVSREVVQTQAGSEPRRTVKCGRRGQRTVACRYFGYGQRRGVQSFGKSVERQLLEEGLSRLSKREQKIIEMRFGLDGKDERTQKEVADLLGISQSYISRLEKKIISRLKREIGKLV